MKEKHIRSNERKASNCLNFEITLEYSSNCLPTTKNLLMFKSNKNIHN